MADAVIAPDAPVNTPTLPPAPKTVAEWANMRGKTATAPVALATVDKVLPVAPAAEAAPAVAVEPVAEVEPEAKPAEKPPITDDYTGLPDEVAAKLRRKEAALVGETTKERNRRHAAEAQAKEASAAREADKARIDKLAEAIERLMPKGETEAPRPRRDGFDTPDAYETALLEWHGKQVQADTLKSAEAQAKEAATKAQREAEQSAANTRWTELQTAHMDRRAKALEAYPDYEAVAEADDVRIAEPGALAIMALDNGPDVTYWLGQNKPDAERIAGLAPIQQAIEMGRISARLEAAKAAKAAASVSRQQAPMKPVGNNQAAAPRSRTELNMEAYAAVRLPELRAERTGGRVAH